MDEGANIKEQERPTVNPGDDVGRLFIDMFPPDSPFWDSDLEEYAAGLFIFGHFDKQHGGVRRFPTRDALAKALGLDIEIVKSWEMRGHWFKKRDEMGRKRLETEHGRRVRSLEEADMQFFKRKRRVEEKFDKALAEDKVDIPASVMLQWDEAERKRIEAIHGVSGGSSKYEEILMQIVAVRREVASDAPET